MKKDKSLDKKIQDEEDYIEFLRKRLNSDNFKKNVSKEEYDLTKRKLDKAKFKLRVLRNDD